MYSRNMLGTFLPLVLFVVGTLAYTYPVSVTNSGPPPRRDTPLFLRVETANPTSLYNQRPVQLLAFINSNKSVYNLAEINSYSPVLNYFVRSRALVQQSHPQADVYKDTNLLGGLETVRTFPGTNDTLRRLVFRRNTADAPASFRSSIYNWDLNLVSNDGSYQVFPRNEPDVFHAAVLCEKDGGITQPYGYGQIFFIFYRDVNNQPMPDGCEPVELISTVPPTQN